jgi:nucleotide-binding universal stress UspA family protein
MTLALETCSPPLTEITGAAWAPLRALPQAALCGSIMVHVPTEGEAVALRLAVELSKHSGAGVVGIGAEGFEASMLSGLDAGRRSPLQRRYQALHARLQEAEVRFREATAEICGRASWIAEAEAPHVAMARHACGADWVLAVRQPSGADANKVPRVSSLILDAGVPVLLAPPKAAPLQARRIVVGWRNNRASRRAIADAMPLLHAAERVHLVSVSPDDAADQECEGLIEVRRRLLLHGCPVAADTHPLCWPGSAATLSQIADEEDADLIVAGGYSHPHVPEWLLGGVSATLVEGCPQWVLLSH